jgi:hypothetical protein
MVARAAGYAPGMRSVAPFAANATSTRRGSTRCGRGGDVVDDVQEAEVRCLLAEKIPEVPWGSTPTEMRAGSWTTSASTGRAQGGKNHIEDGDGADEGKVAQGRMRTCGGRRLHGRARPLRNYQI